MAPHATLVTLEDVDGEYAAETHNHRSLRNFPMQANGAEMLRLACILATEGGVKVLAPVHDAILIEAPLEDIESAVSRARNAMNEASEIVLDGLCLRTDAETIRFPAHYQDPRGEKMWTTVTSLLEAEQRDLRA